MSEFPVNAADKNGSGCLSLYEIGLENQEGYYAKVDRKYVTVENLIARIMKRNAGVNENQLLMAARLFHDEILTSLSNCECVDVIGLGSLYPSVEGKVENKTEVNSLKKKVKFTPSKQSNEAVEKITFTKVTYGKKSPSLVEVINMETNKKNDVLYAGCGVLIKGRNLKFVSSDDKVFLALSENNELKSKDASEWIECSSVYSATDSKIMLVIPNEIPEGNYQFVVKSFTSGHLTRKYPLYGYSRELKIIHKS